MVLPSDIINSKQKKEVKEKQKKDIQRIYDYCKRYQKHYSKFPTLQKIVNASELTTYQIKNILRFLELKGFINRNHNYYSLPPVKKKQNKTKIKKVIKKLKETKITIINIKLFILKLIIFIVGSIATILSIYYTKLWFVTMMTPFKSFFLSLCMVGFLVSAFEIIILFWQNKQFILSFVFSFLWIIVVLFSMSTTLSGQLNLELQKKIKEDNINLVDNNQILLYQNYSKRIKDFDIDLQSKRKEREKLQEFLLDTNYDNTSDMKKYKEINYRIYLKNIIIDKIKKETRKLEKEKVELLKKDVKVSIKVKINFFTWMEKILKIKADILRFILFFAPAVFLDIIAPASFAIVLFYKQK